MILPFSTQLNEKPTYFVEKILSGFLSNNLKPEETQTSIVNYSNYLVSKYEFIIENIKSANPKLHTIREDKTDRWKIGNKIDFFINCRQKDMFRFAPVLNVFSIQEIEIEWHKRVRSDIHFWYKDVSISINKKYLSCEQCIQLAENDGFDSVEEFFEYFNEDFKGKLIHWTNLNY